MSRNFFKAKFKAGIFIITFLLSLIILNSPTVEATSEDEIIMDFSFQEPIITEVNISNITYHKIMMNETHTVEIPGTPILPVKPLKILLPQKGVIESINVTYEDNTSLGYEYNVLIAEDQNQSNETNFNSSLPYPTELYVNLGVQWFRGYEILLLNLFPIHYIGDTGEIYYYKNMTITVKTNDSGSVNIFFRGLSMDESLMKLNVDDYSKIDTYTVIPDPPSNSSLVPADEEYELVIITTHEYAYSNSVPTGGREWNTFQDLANYKNSKNIPTKIVDVEEILNEKEYDWDGEWGDIGENGKDVHFNDEACHIRNFIKDAYTYWDIEYVLLGGGFNDIPYRDLHVYLINYNQHHWIPSDLYFACIDPMECSWDYNTDDNWGESNDGVGGNEVDLYGDVFVGRALVNNLDEVSNFVYKTLAYEDDEITPPNDPYIQKALLVADDLNTSTRNYNSKAHKEEIREYCNNNDFETYGIPEGNGNGKYTIDTLYDWDYPQWWPIEFFKLELINKINDVYLINYLSHGLQDGFYRNTKKPDGTYEDSYNSIFSRADSFSLLGNNKYFFMYGEACLVGDFTYEDFLGGCLAEYLTTKTKHGAFAVIMNSDYAWLHVSDTYGPSHRFDRAFWDVIYTADPEKEPFYELGKANQLAKHNDNIINDIFYAANECEYLRFCYYELNLFGDPTAKIKLPIVNNNPYTPGTPDCSYQCSQSYSFNTYANDPEGDQVSYKWKINNEEYPLWSKYYNSNETIYQTLELPSGNHQIRVKSRDIYSYESSWSNPLNITVPFNPDIQIKSNTVVLGNTINLYGKASGGNEPYNSWHYDLGDGNFSEQQNTTYVYNTIGTYNVTLNVTDSQNITSNITQVINVVILKADFNTSQGYSMSTQTISFNDTSDGYYNIVNWSWDFDDGNTSYNRNTTHVFTNEGIYNVTLTVIDNQSNTGIHNQIIYVDETSPDINSVSKDFDIIGYGTNITFSANISDTISGVKNVNVNVTYPDSSTGNFTTNNTNNNSYEYTFSDTYKLGDYSFIIWTIDNANNTNISSDYTFTVSPILGYNKIGDSNQSIYYTITGSVFTSYEKVVADNITVYIDPCNATSDDHYQCVIYRHNDSELIGVSEEKNVSSGKGWQTFSFSVPKPILENDTEYVLCCWSNNYTVSMYYDNGNGSEMYYDDGNSTLQGHYFEGYYNYTPDPVNFNHEDRKYSIYCNYSPDTTAPEITNVYDNPGNVGFGFNVTINADVVDNASGIDFVKVNITYPDDTTVNFSMNNTGNNTYEYVFTDTWIAGQYNYSIWTVDNLGNSNNCSCYSFNVSAQTSITVCTVKDDYSVNETLNLTDPPGEQPGIGYELIDDQVLHIWNNYNSYYFDTSSGIQLTNHYDEYWTHNVLMLGYYNNDVWNLIYRTDELNGFTKNITTDNVSFINVTFWKDLTYGGYDFRLAIRYNLGVEDTDLTVIPYIKNLDENNIPYVLGFGWEMKDIRIANSENDNYLRIFNGSGFEEILLNQTLDRSFTDLDYNTTIHLICTNPYSYHVSRNLYLSWSKNLTYKVTVKSRAGQYNAPVSLFIRIGTLNSGQEKSTLMHWLDSDDWLGIGSSVLAGSCEGQSQDLKDALDGLNIWSDTVNHEHWFILDLGQQYNIEKFRGRSIMSYDPTDVDIYISSDNSSWGAAIASNIDAWQDTNSWQEVDSVDKEGRYIKVVIQDTEATIGNRVDWGKLGYPAMTIFDVYGKPTNFGGCSQDGYIYASSASYNTAYNATSGTVDSTNASIKIGQTRTSGFPSYYKIYRGFLFFNTSAIRVGDTINSCKLHFYLNTKNVSLRNLDIVLQHNTSYPHDPLQSWDYNKNYYNGDGGSINTNNMSAGNWYTITFNSTALDWIKGGGMTRLCLRSNWDIACDDPSGVGDEYVVIGSSESSHAPYLEIDCSPMISGLIPVNGTVGVSIATLLNITIYDGNGDDLNITWFSNCSGSWQVFGTNNSVSNGSYHQIFSNATMNGQWWYWKVNVSDDINSVESDVYMFYTGYQSKIENTGSYPITGYLLIQVQYYNTTLEDWVLANDTVNETSTRTINISDQLGLDTIFNGKVSTNNLLNSFGSGTYRVYACFRDPYGNVLLCDDDSLMEATYEFTLS